MDSVLSSCCIDRLAMARQVMLSKPRDPDYLLHHFYCSIKPTEVPVDCRHDVLDEDFCCAQKDS